MKKRNRKGRPWLLPGVVEEEVHCIKGEHERNEAAGRVQSGHDQIELGYVGGGGRREGRVEGAKLKKRG